MPYRALIAKYVGEKNVYLKYAPEYYNTFPHDNQIEIELPARVLSNNTFLDLMKAIASSRNRCILIVAHGSEKHGLYLDIGCKKKIFTYQVMFRMLLYIKISEKFNEPGTKTNPEKLVEVIRYIRDYNIDTPDDTMKELSSLDRPPNHPVYDQEMIRLGSYKRMPENSKEEIQQKEQVRKGLIKMWVKYINQEMKNLEKIFRTKKILTDYLKAIRDVQSLQLSNIAIRGCNIGKDKSLLEIYRRFFNAVNINGPKVKIKYGKAFINLRNRQSTLNIIMKKAAVRSLGNKIDPENWIGGPSTPLQGPKEPEKASAIYYHPPGLKTNKDELLLTVRSSTIYIVAEHIDVALEFAVSKFGTFAPVFHNQFRRNKKTKQFEMPVCCLEKYPLTFPMDLSFSQSLESASG